MRLGEYLDKLGQVIHHFQTQRDVMEAIAKGKGETPGHRKFTYDHAIEEVRDTFLQNKKLLGVFDEHIEQTAEGHNKAKERIITPNNLKRHVIKSRYDLRHFKPKRAIDIDMGDDNAIIEGYKLQAENVEEIVVQILAQLSEVLGVNASEVGSVFGPTEKELHYAFFERDQLPKPSKISSTFFPPQTNGTTTSTIYPPASSNPAVQQRLSNPPVPHAPALPRIQPAAPSIPTLPKRTKARLIKRSPANAEKLLELTEKALAERKVEIARQRALMSEADREAQDKLAADAAGVKDSVAERIKLLEQNLRERKIIQ